MSRLLWGEVGDRFYETGVDRGVLYLADGSGVAWTGLTRVEEDFGGDGSEPRYFDGIKYLDDPQFGDYSAMLNAFTYPDEFLEYEGVGDLGNGLYVDDQSPKMFGLSYRTLVGNDTEGSGHAYKIHILYNLTATIDSTAHQTLSDSKNPLEFGWKLSSVPEWVTGYRPTAHIYADSRLLSSTYLQEIENILYGSPTTDARLPTIDELIDLVT